MTTVNATFMKIEFYLVNCTQQAWGLPCSPTPIGPLNTMYLPAKRSPATPVTIPTGSKAYVAAVVQLSGITAASFGAAQASQFSIVMSSQIGAGVAPADVTVTSVTDIAGGRRSRALLATGVNVGFSVATSSPAAAVAVSSSIVAVTSNSAALTSALQAGGLTGVTGVALTTAPTTSVSASAPASVFAGRAAAVAGARVSALLAALLALLAAAL